MHQFSYICCTENKFKHNKSRTTGNSFPLYSLKVTLFQIDLEKPQAQFSLSPVTFIEIISLVFETVQIFSSKRLPKYLKRGKDFFCAEGSAFNAVLRPDSNFTGIFLSHLKTNTAKNMKVKKKMLINNRISLIFFFFNLYYF